MLNDSSKAHLSCGKTGDTIEENVSSRFTAPVLAETFEAETVHQVERCPCTCKLLKCTWDGSGMHH